MGTPNCWYDHYLWYMSKLRWRKSYILFRDQIVHSPVDFPYKWRAFHRTPFWPGRTRRLWPLIDPIQGYNISKNCDDASPRFFVRLDSIWGFCVLGANWEGPVGSPTAWKNKRPRPVAVLIPGYNICKICYDASLNYFRRIFWKSLFWHFPDSLDVGFGGSYPRPLRPAGT